MRKLFTFMIALALTVGAAASSFGGSMLLLGVGGSSATYQGPGDIVSGAVAFYSCRADDFLCPIGTTGPQIWMLEGPLSNRTNDGLLVRGKWVLWVEHSRATGPDLTPLAFPMRAGSFCRGNRRHVSIRLMSELCAPKCGTRHGLKGF